MKEVYFMTVWYRTNVALSNEIIYLLHIDRYFIHRRRVASRRPSAAAAARRPSRRRAVQYNQLTTNSIADTLHDTRLYSYKIASHSIRLQSFTSLSGPLPLQPTTKISSRFKVGQPTATANISQSATWHSAAQFICILQRT